jgi:dsDNA-binding SOS-regulon protein
MTPQINTVLENIRHQLEQTGPAIPGVTGDGHLAGEPGSGEAENVSPVEDAFDMYISDIVDIVMFETDMSDTQATDFVFHFADHLASQGQLDPLPEDESEEEELAVWMAKAKTVGFGTQVLKAARDQVTRG